MACQSGDVANIHFHRSVHQYISDPILETGFEAGGVKSMEDMTIEVMRLGWAGSAVSVERDDGKGILFQPPDRVWSLNYENSIGKDKHSRSLDINSYFWAAQEILFINREWTAHLEMLKKDTGIKQDGSQRFLQLPFCETERCKWRHYIPSLKFHIVRFVTLYRLSRGLLKI